MTHKKILKVVECSRACLSFGNLLPRFLLLSIIAYWISFSLPLSAAEQAEELDFKDVSEHVRQEFHSGNVVDAISLLDQILNKEEYQSAPFYRLIIKWKLEICELIHDSGCIYSESRRLNTAPLIKGAELLEQAENAYYHFLNIKTAENHQAWLDTFPRQNYWALPMTFVNPPMSVKTSLLEAHFHSQQDNAGEARLAADRALSLLESPIGDQQTPRL